MSRCTKSMQKIASLYILVHIYIVTTALRMCHALGFSNRRVSTNRHNTRQKHSGHLQHRYQDSHIRYTAVMQSSPTPTVALLGINMTWNHEKCSPCHTAAVATAHVVFVSVLHCNHNTELEAIQTEKTSSKTAHPDTFHVFKTVFYTYLWPDVHLNSGGLLCQFLLVLVFRLRKMAI